LNKDALGTYLLCASFKEFFEGTPFETGEFKLFCVTVGILMLEYLILVSEEVTS